MAADFPKAGDVSNQLYCRCPQGFLRLEEPDARQTCQSETLGRDRHL